MSLLDKLLKADAEKANEETTEVFYSKMLQKVLGEKEPVPVTIKKLKYQKINSLLSKQFDDSGNFDFERSSRAKALMAAEAVVDPDLKAPELIEHFGCATPADLAEKLFSLELTKMSDIICELAGLVTDENKAKKQDEEIKN